MLVVTLLVTFLLTRACSGTCVKDDGGCCYPTIDEAQPQSQSDKLTSCPSIKYNVIGWDVEESGHLNIMFPLPAVNCSRITCFELTLLVDERLTEDECTDKNQVLKFTVDEEFKHSQRYYLINNGCHPKENGYQACEATGVISFNFVFTGCYQVAIQPMINTSTSTRQYSLTKYLRTNYTKNIIARSRHTNSPSINVTDQYFPALNTLEITFPVDHLSCRYKIVLNTDTWSMACNNTARECESPKVVSTYLPSKCAVNSTAPECKSAMVPSNYPPSQCTVSNGSITCSFSEVAPGDYCFTMSVVVDDRCESGTIWTKPRSAQDCPQHQQSCTLICNWQYNFTARANTLPISRVVEQDWDSSHFYIILAAAMTVIVAVTIVFLLLLRAYTRRYYPRTPLEVLPNSALPMEMEPCRIFLLYARDCQPFMELMATLRELLEGATKSEVIDCLDPSRWNDIGRSPVEWVRRQIEHPHTKVMLVATPCGHLRQQGHLNQTLTYYKKPDTYDNLFTYGLKTLTDNLSQDIYRKICVVRFEGFSDDGNLFSHLTPYTRFVLPLHLHQLILTLKPSATADEDVHLVEDKEVQRLCQDLTNLINYKNTNVNYLQDMLIVQRNDVN